MAKKNKNAKNKSTIDINQSIIDGLTTAPEALPEESDDNEFEQLLNNFIGMDTSAEPAGKQADSDDVSDELPETSSNNDFRRQMSMLELNADEKELAQAYANFIDSVIAIATMQDILIPPFVFKPAMLMPNYKPSTGRKIVSDVSLCWDIMLQAFPDRLSSLSPNSSDEEFLNFAESLSDQNLQLAIISYVEILIDIENCEVSYEEKRLKAQRRRIERELYEEYQRRCERKLKFINEIQKRDFPVDAERLINNYFKTAGKDAEGAYAALTVNPAVYAPIETKKIKPRFFGLLKVTPKDGIRENHRLGKFLKHLKV